MIVMKTKLSSKGRQVRVKDSIRDLAAAIAELKQAHSELVQISEISDSEFRLAAMALEPVARVNLAVGYAREILKRHKWKESDRDEPCDDPTAPARKSRKRFVAN